MTNPVRQSKPFRLPDSHAQMEQASDDLLASVGALRSKGVYTNRQLSRKIKNEHRRSPVVDETGIWEDAVRYLVQRQTDELVEVSGLTAMQELCYRLYVSGLSCRDIAASLEVRHQVIAVHLRAARARIRAACADGRYSGWYEVYLSEVNRTIHRRRAQRRQ